MWEGLGNYAVLAIIAGSVAIGIGRKVVERAHARRELRNKARLDTDAGEGEVVRVTGVVMLDAGTTLEAPLSGRPCVVARSRVREAKSYVSYALKPKETMAMVPFLLDCGERGIVRIEGEHVLLDLPPLKLPRRKIDEKRRERFLVIHGIGANDRHTAVFEETIVEAGMRVSIAGLVMKDIAPAPPSGERGFRDELPTQLRLAGNASHPLVIGKPVD